MSGAVWTELLGEDFYGIQLTLDEYNRFHDSRESSRWVGLFVPDGRLVVHGHEYLGHAGLWRFLAERRDGAGKHGLPRRGVRRARPLLPRGDHAMDRAAALRGHSVRDGRRVDRGVRVRARCAAAQRSRLDRPSAPDGVSVIATPSFVLSGPGGTLVADGVHTAYPDLAAARSALRTSAATLSASCRAPPMTGSTSEPNSLASRALSASSSGRLGRRWTTCGIICGARRLPAGRTRRGHLPRLSGSIRRIAPQVHYLSTGSTPRWT